MLYLDYDRGKSKDKTALVLVYNCLSDREMSTYFILNDVPQDTESAEIVIKSLAKIRTLTGFRRFYYWLKNGKKKPADGHFKTYMMRDGEERVVVGDMRLKDFKRVYIKNLRTDNCVFQIDEKQRLKEKFQFELEKGGWATIDEGYIELERSDSKIKKSSGLCNEVVIMKGEE